MNINLNKVYFVNEFEFIIYKLWCDSECMWSLELGSNFYYVKRKDVCIFFFLWW